MTKLDSFFLLLPHNNNIWTFGFAFLTCFVVLSGMFGIVGSLWSALGAHCIVAWVSSRGEVKRFSSSGTAGMHCQNISWEFMSCVSSFLRFLELSQGINMYVCVICIYLFIHGDHE